MKFRQGLLALFVACSLGFAQQTELEELQNRLTSLAEVSIPKTVLIASQQSDGQGTGFGSGALISADGYILTCSHVIDIGPRATVTLSDGRAFEAQILGRNRAQDYALLKIEAEGLEHFEIGSSTELEVGSWVVALGHPGGPYSDVQPTFALGKVKALHKQIPVQMMDRFYNDAIETDVPIYAGNSGGPLIDLDGKLLGLNGAILMMGENAYASPIDQIMADYERLAAGEEIEGEKLSMGEMFTLMQEQFSPEMMEQMQERMGKMFGQDGMGEMFGNLFGDNERMQEMLQTFMNPEMMEQMQELLGGLFNGENGENPLGNLFGEDGGGMQEMLESFMNPEMQEQMQKMLQGMFNGENGENPFGNLFGEDGGGMQEMLEGLLGGNGENPLRPETTVPEAPRAYLGVKAEELETGGVKLTQISPDGPASFSKLEAGDLLRSIDGQAVQSLSDMGRIIGNYQPGDMAVFEVEGADGSRREVKVIFGNRD